MNKITDVSQLEQGELYKVNGRKCLYWDGSKWMLPSKFKGYVRYMDEQPIFKYAVKIE